MLARMDVRHVGMGDPSVPVAASAGPLDHPPYQSRVCTLAREELSIDRMEAAQVGLFASRSTPPMEPSLESRVQRFESLLNALGRPLDAGMRVLDFGCGEGDLVEAFSAAGYDAWGCDLETPGKLNERIKRIEVPYRVPFPDSHFDFVCSTEVLEHVEDHDQAFCEISRVLRPGGISLHVFPPPFTPLEQHSFVPLAGVIRTPAWLGLWARLGIRNSFQRGLSPAEVARRNREYLTLRTKYLRRGELLAIARRHFVVTDLVERQYLETARPDRRWLVWLNSHSGIPSRLYSGLRSRVLVAYTPEP